MTTHSLKTWNSRHATILIPLIGLTATSWIVNELQLNFVLKTITVGIQIVSSRCIMYNIGNDVQINFCLFFFFAISLLLYLHELIHFLWNEHILLGNLTNTFCRIFMLTLFYARCHPISNTMFNNNNKKYMYQVLVHIHLVCCA